MSLTPHTNDELEKKSCQAADDLYVAALALSGDPKTDCLPGGSIYKLFQAAIDYVASGYSRTAQAELQPLFCDNCNAVYAFAVQGTVGSCPKCGEKQCDRTDQGEISSELVN